MVGVLGHDSLWVSHISACLIEEALVGFVLDYIFWTISLCTGNKL